MSPRQACAPCQPFLLEPASGVAWAKLNSFILMTALEQHHLVWPVPPTSLEPALPFEGQMMPLTHGKVRLLKQRVTGDILMDIRSVGEPKAEQQRKGFAVKSFTLRLIFLHHHPKGD